MRIEAQSSYLSLLTPFKVNNTHLRNLTTQILLEIDIKGSVGYLSLKCHNFFISEWILM